VINMPRTAQQIIDHAAELETDVARFEAAVGWQRVEGPAHDALSALRDAALARGRAEDDLRARVADARQVGVSWRRIGTLVGTSGQAAQARYGNG
jgi:hypothetical protein